MAERPRENSANAPQSAPKTSLPEVALPKSAQENYDEIREAKVDKVEKTFEDRISAGSVKLDEKALTRLRNLKEKQKREISEIFEKRRREFGQRIGAGSANHDALAAELIKTAAADADKRIAAIDLVIKAKTKEQYITTDEAAEIEKAVIGVEKLAGEDKKLQATAEKIFKGGTLTDEDYSYVAGILNPYDYNVQQRKDVNQAFEATSSGVLVGMMKPGQRFRLIQVFMDSPKKAESPQLIDAFLRTGILNRDQGGTLFQEAVTKGIITQQQYQNDLKAKLDQGYYQQETAKFRAIIEQERNRDYRGTYSENIANRVVGAPMLGAFAALWGSVLTLLNVWTTLSNKEDHNKLASLLKNPYVYAGMGAMALGTEVATGTMKKGAGLVGGGVVGRALDTLGESDAQQKTAVQERARGRISDIMLNSPKELVTYLDEGGFATILELRKNKIAKKEQPLITIAELAPLEQNQDQATKLNNLKTLNATSERETNIALTTVAEASSVLKIENKDAFAKLVVDIRQKQKSA
jgi:hypothetical protein